MIKRKAFSLGFLALAFALAFAGAASAAAPAAARNGRASARTIAYENLHGYLGDRITVHTKFRTTRTGVLAKFSKSELTLTLETAGGPTELTIPKDTIAEIVAATAAGN